MATCLSGIQPTGRFHIGNYLGCIKPFLSFNPDSSNKSRKNIFLVADMHCFTKPTCNLKVNESVLESVRSLIAIGVCSSNTSIVQQSKISQHAHLAWYLSCFTKFSRAENMIQFKNNSQKFSNVGLFIYPILQAADILIYRPDNVFVGPDQAQHIELAIELSKNVNKFARSNIFKIPKANFNNTKIKSLKDETKKMSKSEPLGCLFLTDGPKESFEKIMKAKTDSYTGISYEKNNRPSLANLIEIMAALKGDSPQGIADKYEKYDHRYFKEELAFEYSKYFDTFRGKYSSVTMAQIKNVIELGASEAQQSASSAMEIFLEALNK